MPSTSERQRRYFGAELGRKDAGEETKTGMTKDQLRDFARKGKRRGKRSERFHGRKTTRK